MQSSRNRLSSQIAKLAKAGEGAKVTKLAKAARAAKVAKLAKEDKEANLTTMQDRTSDAMALRGQRHPRRPLSGLGL